MSADIDQLRAAIAEADMLPWGLVGGAHDRVIIDSHGCHTATTGTFPDAVLIVSAVNNSPALIAELEQLRAMRQAMRQAVEGLAGELEQPMREDVNVAAGLVRRARAAMSDDERDAAVAAVARDVADERSHAATRLRAIVAAAGGEA